MPGSLLTENETRLLKQMTVTVSSGYKNSTLFIQGLNLNKPIYHNVQNKLYLGFSYFWLFTPPFFAIKKPRPLTFHLIIALFKLIAAGVHF